MIRYMYGVKLVKKKLLINKKKKHEGFYNNMTFITIPHSLFIYIWTSEYEPNYYNLLAHSNLNWIYIIFALKTKACN